MSQKSVADRNTLNRLLRQHRIVTMSLLRDPVGFEQLVCENLADQSFKLDEFAQRVVDCIVRAVATYEETYTILPTTFVLFHGHVGRILNSLFVDDPELPAIQAAWRNHIRRS